MESEIVAVVQLSPEEWFAYKELRLEALQTEPQAFGASYADSLHRPDTYWQTRLQDAAAEKGNWLLFAREHSRIIGMIGAWVNDDPQTADIISVYVVKAARGRGIGSLLMGALLQRLTQTVFLDRVRLTVNTNQSAALAMYTKFGFVVVGEEEAQLGDGNRYRECVMEKSLR